MGKKSLWTSVILAVLLLLALAGPALGFEVNATSAILIDAGSGQIIYQQNAHESLPPASTTKILTALTALDSGADRERLHPISQAAAGVGESSAGLIPGEALSLQELLRGALVHSGNDACYAIGEIVAGSEPLFVHWLNQKAAVLGAYSVHFVNTNGLPDDAHVVSGEDLAVLAAAAMADPDFREIVGSKYTSLGSGDRYRYYKNTNKLLWQDDHVIGVKTGTTDAAGPCLVAAYAQGPACFLSVVLNSPDRYGESLSLLRWADSRYVLVRPLTAGTAAAWRDGRCYAAEEDLQALIPVEDRPGLSLRWALPDGAGQYWVALLDADGSELARTILSEWGPEQNIRRRDPER